MRYFRNLFYLLQVVRTIKKLDRQGKLEADMTMGEFIARAPFIDARFVDEVFYPLLHLAFHASHDEMAKLPVSTFLPTWASAADNASTFYCVDGGVRNYVEAVRRSLLATKVKTGADVVALCHTGEATLVWQVTDADERCEAYDQVIVAIWPNQVAEILKSGLDASKTIRPHLEASEVFTSFDWSMDMDDLTEARTITQPRGPIHGVHPHSRTPPRQALHEARAFLQNQQGEHGLWFTGSYLRETCFHVDGLAASLDVLQRLRPDHSRLSRLGKLLSRVPTPWRGQ